MSMLATASVLATRLVPQSGDEYHFDDKGYITANPIFAPFWEVVIGSTASIIVFVLIWKFAGPTIKKSFTDRTAGVQQRLDDSAAAKAAAEAEAIRIREAKGDIDAERARLYAEADTQAEALLADGRIRLQAEIAELETRAESDIASAAGRGTDELRAEISRYSGGAVDAIVRDTLDDAAQQELIETFIARVGASTGASA